jgi:uncharacterized membrane protein
MTTYMNPFPARQADEPLDVGEPEAATTTKSRLKNRRNLGSKERLASVIAGSLLSYYGLRKRSQRNLSLGLTALGSAMIARGASGYSGLYGLLGMSTTKRDHGPAAVMTSGDGVRVEETISITRPADELFRVWRDLRNLPKFMSHVASVDVLDTTKSRWTVNGPMNKPVHWYADIINEEPDSMIAWRSVPGSEIDTAGSVHFTPKHGERDTEVKVVLRYDPPAGKLGAAVASLLGKDPGLQVREDLQRFKRLMEAPGELA